MRAIAFLLQAMNILTNIKFKKICEYISINIFIPLSLLKTSILLILFPIFFVYIQDYFYEKKYVYFIFSRD